MKFENLDADFSNLKSCIAQSIQNTQYRINILFERSRENLSSEMVKKNPHFVHPGLRYAIKNSKGLREYEIRFALEKKLKTILGHFRIFL